MGCNISRSGEVTNQSGGITQDVSDSKNSNKNEKNYVVFDIDLNTCDTVGDFKGDHLKHLKIESRIPPRLTPIQNPPILTTEMIEEKLRKAEEKREQLLASRRIACQRAKQAPGLVMQGKRISPDVQNDMNTVHNSTAWMFNWSGDEILTDEQLDDLLQSEVEYQKTQQENI